MFSRMNLVKVALVGVFLFLVSGLAFALPVADTIQPLEDQADSAVSGPSFSLANYPTLSTSVIPSRPQSPPTVNVDPVPVISSVSSGSGSSLTITEMRLVMDGGKNYNFDTKEWGYRDEFKGMMRERFMLSWEKAREKVGAVELLPYDLRYSK